MRISCVVCFGVAVLFSIPANSQTSYPHFQDVARASGLSVSHISGEKRYILESMSGGVGLFDCDNDGKLDVVVVNGSTVDRFRQGGDLLVTLYHQDSDFHFTDITQQAGLTRKGWGMGVAVADFDNDGRLDLFVTGYGGTALYRNLGNCKFEDVTERAGLKVDGLTTGAAWADYDRDGFVDLFVARYVHVDINKLPEPGSNQHDGTFEEVGLLSGTALSGEGQEQGSMGVDFGDFDHDGLLDIIVTNFAEQADDLYHNEGPTRGFLDLAWSSKIGQVVYPYVRWGTGFVDFDNDGWPDIFIASGHVYPQVDSIANNLSKYRQPMFLFRNKGDRTFEDITRTTGLSSVPLASRRGAAFGDVKNDGNIAILVLNVGTPPSLFIQDVPSPRHRVLFRLVGTKSNRAAIGARVTITGGGITQFNEVRGGGSYLSQNDLRIHFGLGEAKVMETVTIRWPNGNTETLRNVGADAIYTITEGQGITSTQQLPPPTTADATPAKPAKAGASPSR